MYIIESCHAMLDLQSNFRPAKYYVIANDDYMKEFKEKLPCLDWRNERKT